MQTLLDRRLLTVRETADRLGVHEDTVRRRIASGELPALQLGGHGSSIRVDAMELECWLYGPPEVVRADLHTERWPATPVPPDPPSGLRVLRSFSCGIHHFEQGEFVSVESPLVRQIWSEYPGLFELVGRPY
jgi:excisionase family DNA binding protein